MSAEWGLKSAVSAEKSGCVPGNCCDIAGVAAFFKFSGLRGEPGCADNARRAFESVNRNGVILKCSSIALDGSLCVLFNCVCAV